MARVKLGTRVLPKVETRELRSRQTGEGARFHTFCPVSILSAYVF